MVKWKKEEYVEDILDILDRDEDGLLRAGLHKMNKNSSVWTTIFTKRQIRYYKWQESQDQGLGCLWRIF